MQGSACLPALHSAPPSPKATSFSPHKFSKAWGGERKKQSKQKIRYRNLFLPSFRGSLSFQVQKDSWITFSRGNRQIAHFRRLPWHLGGMSVVPGSEMKAGVSIMLSVLAGSSSFAGCFSKDQVYLEGILQILRHRQTIDFRLLAALGKVRRTHSFFSGTALPVETVGQREGKEEGLAGGHLGSPISQLLRPLFLRGRGPLSPLKTPLPSASLDLSDVHTK